MNSVCAQQLYGTVKPHDTINTVSLDVESSLFTESEPYDISREILLLVWLQCPGNQSLRFNPQSLWIYDQDSSSFQILGSRTVPFRLPASTNRLERHQPQLLFPTSPRDSE